MPLVQERLPTQTVQQQELIIGMCACRCFAACPRCTGDLGSGSHCKRKGKFFNCRRRRQQVFNSAPIFTTFPGTAATAVAPPAGDPPQSVSSSQPPPPAFPFPPSQLVPSTPGDTNLANRASAPEPTPTPSIPDILVSANTSSPIGTTPEPAPVPDRIQSPANATPENTLAASVTAPPPFRPPPGVCSQSWPVYICMKNRCEHDRISCSCIPVSCLRKHWRS